MEYKKLTVTTTLIDTKNESLVKHREYVANKPFNLTQFSEFNLQNIHKGFEDDLYAESVIDGLNYKFHFFN